MNGVVSESCLVLVAYAAIVYLCLLHVSISGFFEKNPFTMYRRSKVDGKKTKSPVSASLRQND